MARFDRVFSELDLTYRSNLNDFYKKHLLKTVDGFEGTRHILWTHMRTEAGYPGHFANGRVMPLSGYLVHKNEGFVLAGDEMLITICGVNICCQTAHFRCVTRTKKK